MMFRAWSTALIALLCMGIISVSSGAVYVRSGSDISGCDMKCPKEKGTLELFRECRGLYGYRRRVAEMLLENHCYYNHIISRDPRLTLDAHSGCWKMTPVGKDDSCVYNVFLRDTKFLLLSSTEIRVLDPVLISRITGTGSRLGEEMAVSVQFSGEESAVTWEVDGEPLPERYRLIDDNRTLIIPSVQRDDAERTIRVRITNPVSEETREYKLSHDPRFSKVLEAEDNNYRSHFILVGVFCAVLVVTAGIIYLTCQKWHPKLKI